MAIKWSPGCNCCGSSDPCEVTTLTNEANETDDGLAQYHTIGTLTAGEKTDLAANKILPDAASLVSVAEPITTQANWSWRVLFENVWETPAKYRILSQANYAASALGDHIFGELEMLAPVAATQWHVRDWPIRLALGKSVSGVETLLSEVYFQNRTTESNPWGPIFPYPATMSLCRGTSYTHFELQGERYIGWVGNPTITYADLWWWLGYAPEPYAFLLRENPATGPVNVVNFGGSGGDRTLKTGDIIHISSYADVATSVGWTVYRPVNAVASPTFTAVGAGLRQGDYLYPTSAGDVVNAADPTDKITVALGESIEFTDAAFPTTTAGWTLRALFDPTAGEPYVSLRAGEIGSLMGTQGGITVRGADVTGMPSGTRVGAGCVLQSATPLKYGGGTYSKVMTLQTPTCPACYLALTHCNCSLSVELGVWATHTSFALDTTYPSITDADDWYYLYHSKSTQEIRRSVYGGIPFGSYTANDDSLCSFIAYQRWRYCAPHGYGYAEYPRVMDIQQTSRFEAYYRPYVFEQPFDVNRLILRRSSELSLILYEPVNLTIFQTCEQIGTGILSPSWWRLARRFPTGGTVAYIEEQTTVDLRDFDCENFSVQSAYGAWSNTLLATPNLFVGELTTWSQV